MARSSEIGVSELRDAAARTADPWPSRGRVGMLCLIASEASFFATLIVAYLFYLGRSPAGPSPSEILRVPLLNTVCLLSSSITIAWAVRGLRRNQMRTFAIAWLASLALGAEFLAGTVSEFLRMIDGAGFTIASNLFGSTFYSLVGFHAAHVAVGLILLATVSVLTARGRVGVESAERVDLLSWYWHFVDGVWVFVFTTVYVVGR